MATQSGSVIFLTGPPASGKTSTSFLWSLQRARPTWPLEWDSIAGSLACARSLAMNCLPADDEGRYMLAAAVMAEQAGVITSGGNDCIAVGGWALDWPGPSPWGPMAALDPIVCVLLPDVETGVARNRSDPRRTGVFKVPETHVRAGHSLDWRRWQAQPRSVILDNSRMTIQQTVDTLEAEVARILATDGAAST